MPYLILIFFSSFNTLHICYYELFSNLFFFLGDVVEFFVFFYILNFINFFGRFCYCIQFSNLFYFILFYLFTFCFYVFSFE